MAIYSINGKTETVSEIQNIIQAIQIAVTYWVSKCFWMCSVCINSFNP